jgi:hypothetical protein
MRRLATKPGENSGFTAVPEGIRSAISATLRYYVRTAEGSGMHEAQNHGRHGAAPAEEPPPLGGSWKNVYISIVIYTLLLVALLYWMTVSLNR